MEILFISCTYPCYYLALESYNLSLSPPPPPPPHKVHVRIYTLEYLRPTNNDCSSRFGVSVLLIEILQNGANH